MGAGVGLYAVVCEVFEASASSSSVSAYKPTPASIDGAPLNPHHTHFVFVDDGKVGRQAWGSEIQLRSALEAAISKAKGIPIVQLVVQGGPGTLQTVESTALAGKPIVVLADTGGAATALHAFCHGGIDAVEPRFQKLEASFPPPCSALRHIVLRTPLVLCGNWPIRADDRTSLTASSA